MDDRRILYLVIFGLLVIGSLVIALVYGPWALVTAVPVLVAAVLLILVPYALLTGLQKWRDQMEARDRRAAGLDSTPKDDAS